MDIIEQITSHQAPEGAFYNRMHLYKQFGGVEGEHWTWMSCDAPLLLYILSAFGLENEPAVLKARDLLIELVEDNGWRCKSDPLLGKFKGPGKVEDPCPYANLLALRALAVFSSNGFAVTDFGVDMLLNHWEIQGEKKYFLFGIGSDFRKIKYPLIWYDILHVLDVLSRFPRARQDQRYSQMLAELTGLHDSEGKYTASSMYRAWNDWSFADKKNPSPWLTFCVYRIRHRSGELVL
jgi:hypothetical protein